MMYMAKYVDLATGDEDKTAGRFVAENKFASPDIIDHFISVTYTHLTLQTILHV